MLCFLTVDDGGVLKSTEFSDYDDPAREVNLNDYTQDPLSDESDSEHVTVSEVAEKIICNIFLRGRFIEINKILYNIVFKKDPKIQ